MDRTDRRSPQVLRYDLENGWTIIAEHTTLKKLDWGRPTETRCSALRLSDAALPGAEILTKVSRSQIIEYWHMDVGDDTARSLAIQNDGLMYDTLGANWIGFNPEVVETLAGNRAPTACFRGKMGQEGHWRKHFGGVTVAFSIIHQRSTRKLEKGG